MVQTRENQYNRAKNMSNKKCSHITKEFANQAKFEDVLLKESLRIF